MPQIDERRLGRCLEVSADGVALVAGMQQGLDEVEVGAERMGHVFIAIRSVIRLWFSGSR